MVKPIQWRYNYNRCALFEDGVVVAALLNVPENDAQKFSQGLYYLQQAQPEPFARNLKLRVSESNFYDFLRQGSADFSGLSGARVDIFIGRGAGRVFAARVVGGWCCDVPSRIKTYVEQKHRTWIAYAARLSAPSVSVSSLLK